MNIYEQMVGKIVARISFNDIDVTQDNKEDFQRILGSHDVTELKFYLTNGVVVIQQHDQDCCESVYLVDVTGDLLDLIGHPLTLAEETEVNVTDTPGIDESGTATFYKFATIKGYVDLRWLGVSNGYYSESVDTKVAAWDDRLVEPVAKAIGDIHPDIVDFLQTIDRYSEKFSVSRVFAGVYSDHLQCAAHNKANSYYKSPSLLVKPGLNRVVKLSGNQQLVFEKEKVSEQTLFTLFWGVKPNDIYAYFDVLMAQPSEDKETLTAILNVPDRKFTENCLYVVGDELYIYQ